MDNAFLGDAAMHFQPSQQRALVSRPLEGAGGTDQYLILGSKGPAGWTTDPAVATAFDSMREATRAALHLPGALRAYGANLCHAAECRLSNGLFQLESNYSSEEDGHRLSHQEARSVDLRSGLADARVLDATIEVVTGREVETTIYDVSECAPPQIAEVEELPA